MDYCVLHQIYVGPHLHHRLVIGVRKSYLLTLFEEVVAVSSLIPSRHDAHLLLQVLVFLLLLFLESLHSERLFFGLGFLGLDYGDLRLAEEDVVADELLVEGSDLVGAFEYVVEVDGAQI